MIAKVKGNKIEIKDPVTLVQGTVGQTLGVELPADWESLSVTAVFSAGAVQRDVPVLGGEITIPWEVLADPHAPLALCFHAAAANGQRVITTANCDPIRIAPSTAPSGQEPEAPSPSRADQIQALAQQALAAAQSVSTQAAQGAFNGRDGVDGTNGTDGTDGISPAVSVSEIQGGHRIQITDAAGSRSFDVLDGAPGEVTEAELETALASKADVNGSYDSMTVGNAKQLVATVGVTDRVPYNFRTAGGSADVGDRASDKIVGGTIAWNQLVRPNNAVPTYTKFGLTFTSLPNKFSFSISGTYAGTSDKNAYIYRGSPTTPIVQGHKYLFTNTSKHANIYAFGVSFSGNRIDTPPAGGVVLSANESGNLNLSLHFGTVANETTINETVHINLFDLTHMFGSAIADYVYGLEQANAGAGVAWFRKLFPKSCYAYNAGELMSVKTSAHETVGFNAYDHATGKAKLVGGAQYQIAGAFTALSLNGESITPDANGYFTPSESGELTVTGGDGSTTCVHLVWSGYRNGEYEPYRKHSYALDSELELRGIPKLDANNNLYYDGDVYESDGKVTRRYGVVDLGTLTWGYLQESWGNSFYSNSLQSAIKNNCTSMRCSAYKTGSWAQRTEDMILISVVKQIRIKDSRYTDAASLKAALSGVQFVYELDNPVTETAEPYQNPQIVDDFGTEEYIDSRAVAIPVGHETFYAANLRDKLQNAPNSPAADGDYILRRNGSGNSYVPLEEVKELPDAPTADGTYSLRVTVSNGTAVYSWTSV